MFRQPHSRLLFAGIKCPLCTNLLETATSSTSLLCRSSCDKHLTSASKEKYYSSLKSLQRHLRLHHQLALATDTKNKINSNTKKNKSLSILKTEYDIDNFLSKQGYSRQTRNIVKLSMSTSFFQRKDRSSSFLFSCTSQSGNGQTINALASLYARLAAGLLPTTTITNIKKKNTSTSEVSTSQNHNKFSPLIFIDFANQPDIFEIFDQVDPGGEFFLSSRRAIIIVLWEPRVGINRLLEYSFARNAMEHKRLFVHQCRRDRESGDLAMADLIARISFELNETIYRRGEDFVSSLVNDRKLRSPSQISSTHLVKFHIVGNDLRHRRCLQDLVGKDVVVGHHSFENTNHHWSETLRNLLFRCLPCACGEVTPPNSKFPHVELSLYVTNNIVDEHQ